MDEGRADAQFLVIGLIADAAAGVEHALADAVDLIFGDNELRIEVRGAAEHRLAKPNRASEIVDVVIDVARQAAALDDSLALQPVARLAQYPSAVRHEVLGKIGSGSCREKVEQVM